MVQFADKAVLDYIGFFFLLNLFYDGKLLVEFIVFDFEKCYYNFEGINMVFANKGLFANGFKEVDWMYKKLKLVGMMMLMVILLLTNEKGAYADICSEGETHDENQSDLQKLKEYSLHLEDLLQMMRVFI